MKEIESKKYLNKQAIYGNDLPVGDPGLPGQMRERDIPDTMDEDEEFGKEGEIDLPVEWDKFNAWYETGGDPSPWSGKSGVGSIYIKYKYDYDYNENQANNIKIITVKENETGRSIYDAYVFESFMEYFEDQIRKDIDSNIDRDI